ncbi:MAG: phage tail protein [bacterium]|nr:phage tail protein [bacterium]
MAESADKWGYPAVSYCFEVSVGKFTGIDLLFSEVSGIQMELETTEIKEGGNNSYTHSIPGRVKYTDLVLKRGMMPKSSALFSWCQKTIGGNYTKPIEPQDVTVKLLDEEGKTLITWNFKNAYPKKLEVSSLNARASGDSAIMIETITLAYSEFERKY